MKIKNQNESTKIFIIAEAGVNHNGSVELAKKMIDAVAQIGVDAVKFQTFKADRIISEFASKANYQLKTTDINESQLDMVKKLELSIQAHETLIEYCRQKNVLFLSSPFDLESIDLLNNIGLETYKIPSGEITNLPYLRKIGSLGKKIIMSVGMAEMREIEGALKILISAGTPKQNITVLHCCTEYPAPLEDVNLLAMVTIRDTFDIKVGYSDHTLGIEVSLAAAALGAQVIEKHFTLDRNMAGPDHKASIEPIELRDMVKSIRNIERALGDGVKKALRAESLNKSLVRKSIVASCDIAEGEIFTENNIAAKRPATGISPMNWDKVIGKAAKKSFKKDELIEL